jgi:photosystem II stability/assembly factor-like uncharacterized protein
LINPSNTAVVYATALSDGKAFKSTNGGSTWDEIHFGFPRLGGCGLVMNPADPSVLFATATVGHLRSADGGTSWQKYEAGAKVFPPLWIGFADLAMYRAEGTLYAASSAGVFKSLDRGESWMTVSSKPPARGIRNIVFDPADPTVIYAEAGGSGLFKTTNGGQLWNPINSGLPDLGVRALSIDPHTSSTLYVGTGRRGVFKSTDGGQSWQPTGTAE